MAGLKLLVAVAGLATIPFAGTAQDSWRTDFNRHTVPLEEIVPGGPPKDGIPSIDHPRFSAVREADRWLMGREPVIVVEHEGDAKAYPYQILIYHEIVNDEVGGRPLVVTYCPLCNTALVFDRLHEGVLLDFGTTGHLRHSDLVMYDRQTESWWQQATGEGIVGELAGERLSPYPARTMSWSEFRESFPGGLVLSRETGFERPYGRNPYLGYDSEPAPIPSFFRKEVDDRLPPMERVSAVVQGGTSVAYPFSSLSVKEVVNDRVNGLPLVVLWSPGTASALDTNMIANGKDVGSSGVFDRRVDGRVLSFERVRDRFLDRETGSEWDITGRSVEGPLAGARLKPLPHGDYLWFAWAAFQPETDVRR